VISFEQGLASPPHAAAGGARRYNCALLLRRWR